MYNSKRPGSRNNRRDQHHPYRRPSSSIPDGFALYYIAIVCPDEVNDTIKEYKDYMQQKYGCRAAQKSPAHLTIIPPFKAEEELETVFKDFVTSFNIGLVPFDIQLKNFSHFGNRVISVDVAPNETLNHLEQEVNEQFMEQFKSIIFRNRPEFHPHVTIATRDIPEYKFDEAWDYFSQQNIEASFNCKNLSVLKLVRGVWEIIG